MRDRPMKTPTLRIDLTLPSTKVTFGVLSYDPLKEMLGFDPRTALAPILRADSYIRTAGGVAIEVFPLALAPGVSASIPLGPVGEFAVANDRGLLALTVPARATRWLQEQVGEFLVAGPQPVVDGDGVHRLSMAWLRLPPGTRTGLPLGLLGEVGIEAA